MESMQEAAQNMSDYDCDVINNGASHIEQIGVHSIKVGSYVMINNRPCKVVGLAKIKDGKHGHAKAVIKGQDIITGKTMECQKPCHGMIGSPKVSRELYTLINIDGKDLSLQNQKGELREDLQLPENQLGTKITNSFSLPEVVNGDSIVVVTVMNVGSEAMIIDSRISQ